MDEFTKNLVAECKRQEESCLYMSTTIFEWLKALRFWRIVFVVAPIILGSLATWQLLVEHAKFKWVIGVCAMLAGVLPAVYKALDFDVSLDTLAKNAHQYKTLQDRFRQAGHITALGGANELKDAFIPLMSRMDEARASSLTPPERFFKKTKKKIDAGHYEFIADLPQSRNPP
jgi:hypothetical protein